MAQNKIISCERCHKSVLVSNVKYSQELKGTKIVLLCDECRNKETIEKKPIIKKQIHKKIYYCNRCNYKFNFNPKLMTESSCPYCGKSDRTSEYKAISADYWINNSKDLY